MPAGITFPDSAHSFTDAFNALTNKNDSKHSDLASSRTLAPPHEPRPPVSSIWGSAGLSGTLGRSTRDSRASISQDNSRPAADRQPGKNEASSKIGLGSLVDSSIADPWNNSAWPRNSSLNTINNPSLSAVKAEQLSMNGTDSLRRSATHGPITTSYSQKTVPVPTDALSAHPWPSFTGADTRLNDQSAGLSKTGAGHAQRPDSANIWANSNTRSASGARAQHTTRNPQALPRSTAAPSAFNFSDWPSPESTRLSHQSSRAHSISSQSYGSLINGRSDEMLYNYGAPLARADTQPSTSSLSPALSSLGITMPQSAFDLCNLSRDLNSTYKADVSDRVNEIDALAASMATLSPWATTQQQQQAPDANHGLNSGLLRAQQDLPKHLAGQPSSTDGNRSPYNGYQRQGQQGSSVSSAGDWLPSGIGNSETSRNSVSDNVLALQTRLQQMMAAQHTRSTSFEDGNPAYGLMHQSLQGGAFTNANLSSPLLSNGSQNDALSNAMMPGNPLSQATFPSTTFLDGCLPNGALAQTALGQGILPSNISPSDVLQAGFLNNNLVLHPYLQYQPPGAHIGRQPGPRTFDSSSVHSPLLHEFKLTSKSRRWELSDIDGHFAEFAGDQYGSRLIQNRLESANSDEKEHAFREIEPNLLQLMTDIYGNYVIQKFFEYGDQTHKKILATRMRGQVLNLSLQPYGCRVVQKALDHVLVDQQAQLVSELEKHTIRCVKDQNGNHVIQKAIERCLPETIKPIIAALQGQCQSLSVHTYGCRVIQRCLENCDPSTKATIMAELLSGLQSMISDQYGNYVVQHVVEHDEGDARRHVLDIIRRGVEAYSKHKFASNVVEKCLKFCDEQWRRDVVQILCHGDTRRSLHHRIDNTESPLVSLVKDSYGNYVVQTLLDVLPNDEYIRFLAVLHPAMIQAKRSTCGKQLNSIEEKMHRLQGQRSRHGAAEYMSCGNNAGDESSTTQQNTPQQSQQHFHHLGQGQQHFHGQGFGQRSQAWQQHRPSPQLNDHHFHHQQNHQYQQKQQGWSPRRGMASFSPQQIPSQPKSFRQSPINNANKYRHQQAQPLPTKSQQIDRFSPPPTTMPTYCMPTTPAQTPTPPPLTSDTRSLRSASAGVSSVDGGETWRAVGKDVADDLRAVSPIGTISTVDGSVLSSGDSSTASAITMVA